MIIQGACETSIETAHALGGKLVVAALNMFSVISMHACRNIAGE